MSFYFSIIVLFRVKAWYLFIFHWKTSQYKFRYLILFYAFFMRSFFMRSFSVSSMSSCDVVTWCRHAMSSSDVVTCFRHKMSARDVITCCRHVMLSHDVVTWRHHVMRIFSSLLMNVISYALTTACPSYKFNRCPPKKTNIPNDIFY